MGRDSFAYKVRKYIYLNSEDVKLHFIPDGYRFNYSKKIVTIIENINTHDLDEKKLETLSWFWFCCDCEGWDVICVLRHFYKNQIVKGFLNLENLYYEFNHPSVKGRNLKCLKKLLG